MTSWMVGIDIGGTFTDVAAMQVETGRTRITKTPSTPDDPSLALRTGFAKLFAEEPDIAAGDVTFFAHGTTVATNALVQLSGAKVGLLVTRGTGAIYELRGGSRPAGADMIDPLYQKPPTLVPRRLTVEIGGRLAYDGSELESLDEMAVREAARRLVADGVTSVAVSYLFSFINPAHELRTRELIQEEYPGCRVSLSCEVLPVIREYRRTSTAVLDAYVGPVIESYLSRVEQRLFDAGVAAEQRFIMQSNGGLMQLNVATSYPSQTLLSGPAAGVVFGSYVGELTGTENMVTFDIGGTSTDISIINQQIHEETRDGQVSGQDHGLPMIQIRTLGAGGGTVAWIGPDGLLKVGPRSAGADPGPVCYGRGGREPTVTDANLVLGYLDPDTFAGGEVHLDIEAARRAIEERIATPLGLSVHEAALGIVSVVNVNMEVGLRLSFMERGFDQRDFTLVAFGGAGPVHAAQIALDLSMPTVVVPPHPGIGCAMGLLQSDVKHHYLRTKLQSLAAASPTEIEDLFGELEALAVSEAAAEGFDAGEVELTRQFDLRYPYQGYELTVDAGEGPFDERAKSDIRNRFDGLHESVYRTAAKNQVPDIVNVRVASSIRLPRLALAELEAGGPSPSGALTGVRPVLFPEVGSYVDVKIYDRARLRAGNVIEGPGIIQQYDSTTVVLPDQRCGVDRFGNLVIRADDRLVPASVEFTPTAADTTIALDSVGLEIIHSRLREITAAMEHVLFHSGYSTLLRESHDGSTGLCTVDARTVITVGAINHLYPYHKSTVAVLETYGEDLHDGDSFILTDPYEAGSSHLPDLVVVTPVFVDGELFAFSVSTAHKPDMGGLVPGSSSPAAREIYHEGLLIPAVRYWTRDGVVREVEAIVGRNSRVPETIVGDLRAQVGCTRFGADRLVELCAEYGTETIREAMSQLLLRTEKRVREALFAWPDGEAEAEAFLDDDGVDLDVPIRLHVKVTKVGDGITIDYSGSNAQVKGPINLGPAVSHAAGLLAVLTHVDPTIPINDGALSVVNYVNPEGLITHPRWPAPVNSYFGTMSVLTDTVGRALSVFNPERAVGSLGYGLGAVAIGHARPRSGKDAVQYELFISSRGGTPNSDGVKGVNGFMNHVPYTPIEIIETEFPIRVISYDWTCDTAGAGTFRGGPGLCKEYELLGEATVTIRLGHQFQHGGFGVFGGGAPVTARATLFTSAGSRSLRPLETIFAKAGDRFRVELPGGGGYGDPLLRDVELVRLDVLNGYVSLEAAQHEYGVWIDPDTCEIDSDRTALARTAATAERPGAVAPAIHE